ncbi:hypothetical protein HMPREF6745_0439 [Prevotella sp. oral taxon 472 str. F0295]|nr:hypothetical protein HMPREF6745_0439 [Prevotella sp. oral taxon 472 str. F0295]
MNWDQTIVLFLNFDGGVVRNAFLLFKSLSLVPIEAKSPSKIYV